MPKSAAGVLFIQESIVVFKIHSRSPILDSANRSGQEVHEDEQGQVEKDEEPEIQPVGVFRKPVHPGLRCLILVPPSSFERAPPFPDTVGTRRRLAHLHLRVVSLPPIRRVTGTQPHWNSFPNTGPQIQHCFKEWNGSLAGPGQAFITKYFHCKGASRF